jgi:hypothetical protein
MCHDGFAVGISERGGTEREARCHSHAQNTTQAGEPACCLHANKLAPPFEFTQSYFRDENRAKTVIAPRGNVPNAIAPDAISLPHCASLPPLLIVGKLSRPNSIFLPLPEDAPR